MSAQWVSDERRNKELEVAPLLFCVACSRTALGAARPARWYRIKGLWVLPRIAFGTASARYFLSCDCLKRKVHWGDLIFDSYGAAARRWNIYQTKLLEMDRASSRCGTEMHANFRKAQDAIMLPADRAQLLAEAECDGAPGHLEDGAAAEGV